MHQFLRVALVLLAFAAVAQSSAKPAPVSQPTTQPAPALPCAQDPARQRARAEELQRIVNADQGERQNFASMSPDQMAAMAKHDLVRRKRVGEIFGEGCLTSAADFAAAALVFQHGDAPEQFFQVFVWAARAIELGDPSQKKLLALGLDRYLVNVGRKQLFASQAGRAGADPCFCLEQVEPSFPDARRVQNTGRTLREALAWVDTLNAGRACSPAAECARPLAPTPAGSVTGFW